MKEAKSIPLTHKYIIVHFPGSKNNKYDITMKYFPSCIKRLIKRMYSPSAMIKENISHY